MSHKLETNGNRVAFVDNRDDAWHRLNQLPKELVGQQLTPFEALKHSHTADWDVATRPLLVDLGNGKTVPNPGKFATTRVNPWTGEREAFVSDGLGTAVGRSYVPVQNEENVDVLQAVIDETGATIDTAGSLNDGKNVFVTMKLPEAITVAGTDQHDLYIAGLNSHDGTGAYTLLVTPVRIVCANTQNYALRNFVNKHTIRHTKSATQKIAKAREALGLTFKYIEEFEQEAERMIETAMTDAEFVAIVNQLWVPDNEPSKRGATIAKLRNDQLMQLFADAETQANVRLTRWAGLQAVTEYVDHFASVRSGGKDDAVQRAERSIIGSQNVRQDAFNLFSVAPSN
jgi:phage/plasmid-like protein (TIGR03299 family)